MNLDDVKPVTPGEGGTLSSSLLALAELSYLADEDRHIIRDLAVSVGRLERDLSAALKDAGRLERQAAVGTAIERAASELPEGFEVEISVERGSGLVVLRDEHGALRAIDADADNRLAAEINAAIDTALAGGEKA